MRAEGGAAINDEGTYRSSQQGSLPAPERETLSATSSKPRDVRRLRPVHDKKRHRKTNKRRQSSKRGNKNDFENKWRWRDEDAAVSLFSGICASRKMIHLTPRWICTLSLPPIVDICSATTVSTSSVGEVLVGEYSSSLAGTHNGTGVESTGQVPAPVPYFPSTGFASCHPLIIFGTFVTVATSDCRVCLYAVCDSTEIETFRDHCPPVGNIDEDPQNCSSAHQGMSNDGHEADNENDDVLFGEDVLGDEDIECVCIEDEDGDVNDAVETEQTCEEDERFRSSSMAHTKEDMISPLVVTEPLGVGAIVSMCAGPRGISILSSSSSPTFHKFSMQFLGNLCVLTSEGYVYILEVMLPISEKSANESSVDTNCGLDVYMRNRRTIVSLMQLKVSVRATFHTGECGATCLCIKESCDDKQRFHLCTGHDSGVVTCHELHSSCTNDTASTRENLDALPAEDDGSAASRIGVSLSDASMHGRQQQQPQDSGVTVRAEIVWKGTFERPVGSLSPLGTCNKAEPSPRLNAAFLSPTLTAKYDDRGGCQDCKIEEDARKSRREYCLSEDCLFIKCRYLAVGLEGHGGGRECERDGEGDSNCAAGNLEVVDTRKLRQEWIAMRGLVPLEKFCVWPGAGMEIGERWMWPDYENSSRIESSAGMRGRGMGSIGAGAPILCACDGTQPCIVSIMSSGVVGIIHSFLNTSMSESTLQWGISDRWNQVLLPQSGFGIGTFDEDRLRVACCTRGGTVYVLPVFPPNERDNDKCPLSSSVEVYCCPSAPSWGDDDDGFAYEFHGFVAGSCLSFSSIGNKIELSEFRTDPTSSTVSSRQLPILAFSSTGGTIDVFSCATSTEKDLICTRGDAGKELMQKLRENGTFHTLVDWLRGAEQLEDEVSQKASVECNADSLQAEEVVQGVIQNEDRFASVSSLILAIATGLYP